MPRGYVQTFGTLGTAGAAAAGTLVAAQGAGNSIYVNDLSINVVSGTVDSGIYFGTAQIGTGVLVRGQYAAGGGIQKTLPEPVGAVNTALTYSLGGAGTVYYNVSYELTE